MRASLLIALLFVALALPLAASADVIVESHSETEFPAELSWDGEQEEKVALRATGTGLRKKAWIKVYAACFYVGADVELGEDPYPTLIEGDFAKAISMHFLRGVGAKKIAGAFQDGIRKTLPEGHDDAVATFTGLFGEDLDKGDLLALHYLPGKGLTAYQNGKALGGIQDPEVIAAIWATWFGEEPISGDLKEGLAGI
jgi:hypothetical protein